MDSRAPAAIAELCAQPGLLPAKGGISAGAVERILGDYIVDLSVCAMKHKALNQFYTNLLNRVSALGQSR